MIELIRNCEHGSCVSTYVVHGTDSRKTIVKLSHDPVGIEDLRREFEGWKWYHLRVDSHHPIACKIVQENPGFVKLCIDYIEGTIPCYTRGLVHNRKYLDAMVSHYLTIWPYSGDLVAMHGDYSLGNAVFQQGQLLMIDWEHFRSSAVFWGFDVVYLLVEALFYSVRRFRRIRADELDVFIKCAQSVQDRGELPSEFYSRPVGYLSDFIREKRELWGDQYLKFPFLSLEKPFVVELDDRISLEFKRCG